MAGRKIPVTVPAMTPEELLRRACQRVAVTEAMTARARAHRRKVIRDLAAEGMTAYRMSRIHPLTVSRYQQIITDYQPRRRSDAAG